MRHSPTLSLPLSPQSTLPLGFPLPPTPPTPKALNGDGGTKDPPRLPFPSVSSACPLTLGRQPGAARPAHESDHPRPRPWPIFSPQFPGPGELALPPSSPLAWLLTLSLSDSGPWTAASASPGSLLEMRTLESYPDPTESEFAS